MVPSPAPTSTKALRVSFSQRLKPSRYFVAVMDTLLNGDPKYITKFLTLFANVAPATGKIRRSYPVVWNEPA